MTPDSVQVFKSLTRVVQEPTSPSLHQQQTNRESYHRPYIQHTYRITHIACNLSLSCENIPAVKHGSERR